MSYNMNNQGSFNMQDFGPGLGEDDAQQYGQMQGGFQQQPMYGGGQQQFGAPNMMGGQGMAMNQMGQQPMMGQQMQYGQGNMGGGFQQNNSFGGGFQQQAPAQSSFDQPAQASGSVNTGGFSVASSSFTTGSKAFVPKGRFVQQEDEFPDLGDDDAPAGGKGKKGKKGQSAQPAAVEKEEELVDNSTPYKGKSSEFFVMNQDLTQAKEGNPFGYTLNDEQWSFVFLHYPEYAAEPSQMMMYLYQQAKAKEDVDRITNEQYAGTKKKKKGDESSEEEKPQKARKLHTNQKQATKDKERQRALAKQQAEAEKLAQVKAKAKVAVASDQVKAESKILKKFNDVAVEMNPEGIKEVDTSRQPCSICFIGHVDAGKSTICGNLMYLMGIVDQRTIDKFKQEAKDKGRDSWWLAYVMDSSDEEKAKGKTVEMGRAQFDTPHKKFTVLDAPGHKNYVPNMIMGAALADLGALVISARKGEFEAGFEKDGQTREHAQLAKSLGIQKLVVVINKMDCDNWSKSRYDEIQTKLKPFLYATGFTDDDLLWVPIVGLSGDNIKEPLDPKVCNWYKGQTLIHTLDEIKLDTRYPTGPLRLPVLDKMKDQARLVVHGKVENGTLTLGDKLAIMPSGAPAQVLEILDATNSAVKHAYPGDNVMVKVNVADDDQIQRGVVLCHRDSMMPVTEIFEAEVDVLELLEYRQIITNGYTCIMHIHTFSDEVEIKQLVKVIETNDKGEESVNNKPKFCRSNSKMICRIAPKNPIALEKLEVMPQMARFTLRDEGRTICIGKVLKYKPYAKGVVGTAKPAAGAGKVTKDLSKMSIKDQSQGKEIVMNLETGEEREVKRLDGIAEGEEDEDEEKA